MGSLGFWGKRQHFASLLLNEHPCVAIMIVCHSPSLCYRGVFCESDRALWVTIQAFPFFLFNLLKFKLYKAPAVSKVFWTILCKCYSYFEISTIKSCVKRSPFQSYELFSKDFELGSQVFDFLNAFQKRRCTRSLIAS